MGGWSFVRPRLEALLSGRPGAALCRARDERESGDWLLHDSPARAGHASSVRRLVEFRLREFREPRDQQLAVVLAPRFF
jgi:hypothetical protein